MAEPPDMKTRNGSPPKGKRGYLQKPYETFAKQCIFGMRQGTDSNQNRKLNQKTNYNEI